MGAPLKVGVNIVFVKPEAVVRVSQAAEQLGFESVWSGEHVALPLTEDWWVNYTAVEAARKAGQEVSSRLVPFKPTTPFLDPLVVLAAIASGTTRLRLGVGIYLLPLRNPILAARSLVSVDVLSNGRLDLGVGLGWTRDEYDFAERDWATRGKRLDESIQALKVLFEEPEPQFHGKLIDFPKLGFEPKPVQRPFPIHVGGFSELGARRAALLGTGWYGSADYIPLIREVREAAGLAGQPFEFSSLSMAGPMARENLERLAEQGVGRAVVVPWTSRKPVGLEGIDMLEAYARSVGLL